MKSEYLSLPYRPNVCIITFQKDKFLLVSLVDWQENWWKFPQGGIDEGEEIIPAGKREFFEEIGTNKIRILGVSKYTNQYDWIDKVIEFKNKKYRGQFQHFVVVEFIGKEEEIKIDPKEVKKYRWADKAEILAASKDKEHMLFQNYNGLIPKILEEFNLL